ncbi:chemotaxis protein CheD [Candidatus Symbiobacter mobilis]|uniref:Probable chemoreceptor glutamine deamidase CheD n=1 Tax=Candidatus Symbiobacter mobilis CR TaxID=946483 RepID=U5N5B8_9BURK|nr:chemotaxis protein CheD [Candidatus Symbiobacter mobilis]AGX86450.1 chemotaxis protein CheD [Candidatus Symbiobacter mobilis CR]
MARIKDLMDIFLQPGEFFVADANFQIRTILGSCVSITLWHPKARIGGMSHFLLPSRGSATPPDELDGRYGDEALQLMARDLMASGVNPKQCKAKIFGGGNMFPGQTRSTVVTIGQRNGEAARTLLQQWGIEVVTESLFGVGHRQIIFNVSNGDVWSRQVRPSSQEIASELDVQQHSH